MTGTPGNFGLPPEPPPNFIPPQFSDNPEDISPGWTSPEDEALAALDGPPPEAYPPGYIEPFDPNPKAADSLGQPAGTQAGQDQIAGWNRGEDGSLMPPSQLGCRW